MIRIALIGGAAFYHALSFSALVNGFAPGQSLPEDWPDYPRVVEDARITVVWDENRAAAEKLAQVYGIEHVVDNLEEVLPHCDVVIVTDDVTLQHYRHAPFFLERGIPTFIDKPLGPDAETAERMVELAARNNTPLMSGSALRYAAETEDLREQPDLLGRIEFAVATGPNDLFFYGIHPLELAHSVMGSGIARVQNIGDENQDVVKVTYNDGRILMLLVSRVAGFKFELTLYGREGKRHISTPDPTAFYANQLRQIAKMARDHKAPTPIEGALEVIRTLEAGKQSLKAGGSIISLKGSHLASLITS